MLIRVTVKHIRQGRARDCERCPIALAALEAGLGGRVETSAKTICWWTDKVRDGNKQSASLPRSARRFVQTFDWRRERAKPFNFKLSPTVPE